ncbi:YqaJ viral recombinase family protein [bacterium]|nr:YqaJ viral recombinase family protein [bacterium]MBQ9149446.1 YqaJ viral recombinase family protein [bacterium]
MFTAEERRNYIGGSDIAAILGMSRWKTPLKLWLEKTGEVEPDDLSENEAVQLGIELEDFVAQKFARENNKKVRKTSQMYVHKKHPFMVAHIDRLIAGADEILECKTCASYKQDEWEEDKIPQEYILQVIWYLGITGKKTGYIAVLIGGQKFKSKPIKFDKNLFDLMVESAKEFWECVQTKTMPAITVQDKPILIKAFPNQNDEYIEKQEMEEKIIKLQRIKKGIKLLEDKKDVLETELKAVINENCGLLTQNYKVSWKLETKTCIDTKQFNKFKKYSSFVQRYCYEQKTRKLYVSQNKKKAA